MLDGFKNDWLSFTLENECVLYMRNADGDFDYMIIIKKEC